MNVFKIIIGVLLVLGGLGLVVAGVALDGAPHWNAIIFGCVIAVFGGWAIGVGLEGDCYELDD